MVTRKNKLEDGLKLFNDFTGHNGEVFKLDKPHVPEVMLVIGYCDGVLYTTVRDGETEKYIHKFAAKSRPLLCSSSDGKNLFILGGEYNFTECGIVDKK